MKIDRNTLVIAIICIVIGYWFASSGPMRPHTPLEDRPVLRFIVKTAKSLLWVALFVEPPPPEHEMRGQHPHYVDEQGMVMVDHGRGW